jgi:hypothetical protein
MADKQQPAPRAGHAGPIALGNEAKKLVDYGKRVQQLRNEINATAMVQCADCWQWIKRDENHTCKPQVKRNGRKGQL